MGKINTELAVFVVFLILVVLWGLFIKTPVDTEPTVNNELKACGIYVRFENGTSDSEVETILENYNMNVNYSIEYNNRNMADDYYIMLDKDERDVRRELSEGMKEEKKDWTVSSLSHVVRKGDSYVIAVSEQAVNDKTFLAILEKYDIRLKKSVWCYIRFEMPDGTRYWIPEEDAIRIKNEFENNESVFSVHIDYIYDQ
ncbi:hypothetical protein MSSIH_3303 [Methanosarcina siciliae HI350]|uniref:Uncharacterized protein n=1 Tax=Methanosarcina siciliae HI350 TaxID=1434119 RepID=A0A0E3PGT5_9EURY|nr:UPF0228 family protein [Methanosarcina siciliae]AKB33993.1 hypothetical protein MSSIH_3303 [Methanosarcina siciliae HI350]